MFFETPKIKRPLGCREEAMRCTWLLGIVLAGPAFGQAAQLGECQIEQLMFAGTVATCRITNLSDRAIADIRYAFRIVEDGRIVPWGEGGYADYDYQSTLIPGGIEPGEVVPVRFSVDRLPERADLTKVHYDIEILEARDVNGDFIGKGLAETANLADLGPPMTEGERDALYVAVQGCWNVRNLFAEAMQTSITVAFGLGRDGRVAEDVEMLASSGDSDAVVSSAFEVARRAILRCQGDGFPLPPDKYEQWQCVEMSFDAARMMIRRGDHSTIRAVLRAPRQVWSK